MRILGDYRKYFQTGTFTVTMPRCLGHVAHAQEQIGQPEPEHSVSYAPDSEEQVGLWLQNIFGII